MKKYKSKIGLELVIPIVVILGGTGASMTYNLIWQGLIVIVLVSVFIVHLFLTTEYTISERLVRIKSGFLYNKTVNIDSIRKITETYNPLSSPALSLDRLEIIYNKYDSILVSPKEKREFIQHITSINPNIVVNLKK